MITALFVLFGTLSFSWALNTLDHALVHSNNVVKVDLTKDDIARTGKSLEEICQLDGKFGAFQFKDEGVIPTDWEVIEFKLKVASSGNVFKVEIFNGTEIALENGKKRQKFAITPSYVVIYEMSASYDAQLNQVNITLFGDNFGFAIWDITVKHNISISSKQVRLHSETFAISDQILADFSYGRQVYLVSSSTTGNRAYMNFTFDDPDSSRNHCFDMFLSSKVPIDVYVSMFGANQAKKLTRLKFSTRLSVRDFCLTKFIYARQLGKFDLSFVFDDHETSEDAPLLFNFRSGRFEMEDQYIRKYLPMSENQNTNEVADRLVGWWYNNPSLFGYTIVAASKTPLYVCDILANCYPLERKQIHPIEAIFDEPVYTFTLGQKYKQLLRHSPFIRLKCDDGDSFVISFNGSIYDRANQIALAQIESNLRVTFSKLHLVNSYYITQNRERIKIFSYQAQAARQSRIALKIPIHTIDPRAHRFVIRIESIGSVGNTTITSNAVHLHAVKVNGVNKLDNNISNCTNYFKISTSDYIQVEQWKMVHNFKSFEIEFEVVDKSHTNNGSQLVDLKIDVSLEGVVTSRLKIKSEMPLKFGNENCLKGPVYGEFDCRYDEYQCPEFYFKYDPIAKTCSRTEEPRCINT